MNELLVPRKHSKNNYVEDLFKEFISKMKNSMDNIEKEITEKEHRELSFKRFVDEKTKR